ncbi:TldD/PmbA family protein, partial [Candidatus Hydrogenedentota bacterium]
MNDTELCKKALLAAEKGGAQAEVFFMRGRATSISVENGEVETLKICEDIGLGLRVILDGGKMGFAHASDLSPASIDDVVESAIANAGCSAPDEFNALAENLCVPDMGFGLVDEDLASVSTDRKVALAIEMEKVARGVDPRVKKVRSSSYADSDGTATIVSSTGISKTTASTFCTASIVTIAEDGDEAETGWEFDYARGFDGLRPEWTGREAGRKAVLLLGGKPVNSCEAR